MRHASGSAPRLLGQDEPSGALAMQFLPPEDHPLWKTQLRDGDADPAFAAGSPKRWCASTRRPPPIPAIAAEFPTDAIFYDIRLEPYLVATARAHPDLAPRYWTPGRHDAGQQARAGARRCQPEEHPVRARRPGVPRCGVRLVGRSGVRPGVLPQSPAAEMPVDAVGRDGLPRLLRCACRRLFAGVAWEAPDALEAARGRICCLGCSWPGWMASRRSSTSPPSATGTGCGASRARCWPTRSSDLAMCAWPGRRSLPHDRHQRSPSCTAAGCGTAAAVRRWRPKCCWKTAPSAAPSRPPAPRPAPARRWICAMAARRSAATT